MLTSNRTHTLKKIGITLLILICIIVMFMLVGFKNKEKIVLEDLNCKEEIFVNADSLVEFALSLKGKKYCYGSCNPKTGFDCSGFIYYVFLHFGIELPRSSYLMVEKGKEVKLENCKKGDLIFFTGTNSEVREVGHVGIVITDRGEPVEFIHSSSGKKNSVVVTPMTSEHYQKRFLKVKRII